MSNNEWNERQREAIEARGKSIVVSAAAGSGKTSVLSERVLRLIEEGEDIENMLIVTFTNLAAGEMKEKIFRRLQEAGSPRLAAQAEKCAFADISTIHAFCGRVIRDNFEHAGITPSFAVADEAQIRVLKQRAMDQALELASKDKTLNGFFAKFSPRGDMQKVKETSFAIFDRIISLKDPKRWLSDAASNFKSEGFVYRLFQEYRAMTEEAMGKAALCIEERTAIWRLRGYPENAVGSEAQLMEMIREAKTLDINGVILPRAEHIRAEEKGAPNRESATLTDRANKYFKELESYTGDFAGKVSAELSAVKDDAQAFIGITRAFADKYKALKKQKSVIDHDDMLHGALKVLGVPEIAARYREKYSHVFVDEYQDINEVQDSILKQVIRGGNDFLVGDVKQCIYMFRESNPDLLIARCGELRDEGLIEMNFNYRSEPGVIDFINGVMGAMMDEQAGGVEYSGGQVLECAREGTGAAQIILAGGEEDSINAEAAAIADYIRKLKSEGLGYSDIAVLRPEISTSGRQLATALSDLGIPVTGGPESADKFSETAVFINLLSVIDSPVSDIAMASVMRFPHFGFTEPEFAHIRINTKKTEDDSFCAAVMNYEEDSVLGRKVKAFLNEIEHYRTLSRCMKLPDFLQRLKEKAGFTVYALTSPGGKGSDSSLGAFISAVTAGGVSGIAGVLQLAGKTEDTRQARPGEVDAVYLTTIHKSKGLEFPAVILSGMHKKINQRDTYGPVLVGRALGLALDDIDGDTRIRKPTFHMKAVARGMHRETISESIRLLYVGMTRAISRLAVVGAGKEIKDKWLEGKAPGWQHDASTYFDLIMGAAAQMCAQEGRSIGDFVWIAGDTPESIEGADKQARLDEIFKRAENIPPADMFEKYNYEADLGVPSKVSVSALKRQGEANKNFVKPVFAESDEGISAAEKGTLTHKILQKMGLLEKSAEEVRDAVRKLEGDGIIGEGLSEYADAQEIAVFLKDKLAERARRSPKVLYEAPFCLKLSAREAGLSESPEEVIVQGVIDMCFLEEGRWVIVDYKTDKVDKNSASEAAEKYAIQLSLYAKALEAITKMKVKEEIVYFLSEGCAVGLK